MKNTVEGKDLRVNVDKTKFMHLLFWKTIVFQKWILVVSVVSGLVVILYVMSELDSSWLL